MDKTYRETSFDEELTKKYIAATENDPLTHVIRKYSILRYAGDVTGKSVLDLGCGTGLCCRAIKQCGASDVLGVDISTPMISYAMRQEAESTLGTQYRVGDGKKLGKVGDYDLVLSNYLLIYMKTVEELKSIVRVIYDNLKNGGKFVGMQFNCFSDDWYDKVAQFKRHAVKIKDLPNGKVVKYSCTALDLDTIQYYFDLPTYQEVFTKVGFRKFTVNEHLFDEVASKDFPDINFKEYLESHSTIVLVAEK